MRLRHPQSVQRHGRSKDDHTLRPHIFPGLALAGGVVIAAVIALLLIGGGGSSTGPLPNSASPGSVRLFPSAVAAKPPRAKPHPRQHHTGAAAGTGGGAAGSAAESQYAAAGDRGSVLDTP
jgi:hypothetical protein